MMIKLVCVYIVLGGNNKNSNKNHLSWLHCPLGSPTGVAGREVGPQQFSVRRYPTEVVA